MMVAKSPAIWLSFLLVAAIAASAAIGPITLSMQDVIAVMSGQGSPVATTVLLDIRLPRAVAAALAGIALGGSGAAMQGLMRNPLAEPGVMGVSGTAALAATTCVYFGVALQSPLLVPLASLAGAMLATAIVAGAAHRMRGIASLILIGVALSTVAGALMALLVNLAPNPFSLSDLINWTAGSVANRDWSETALAAPFIATGILILWSTQRALSALAMGEEAAHGLGVDLKRTRLLIIAGTGLATGGSVALAGMIGFVGLIAPFMVRASVGHDAGRSVLPSALVGGTLLVVADLGIRIFPFGNELHLGTLAALIGAPLFGVIAVRLGNVRHA